ncbi:MAG: hypothetical protein JW959_05100 [Pirellulales bacterium]|nr:hypothetical protein [Pirellulales bacterium]
MPRSELEHLELLAEVDALVGRLNRWAEDAPNWRPAEKCRALVRRLVARADSLRVRIESPLVAATLGGTGAGKSALLNALLGDELLRTGRSRPTTTRPTLICRPNISPEMLGIDPASVELIHVDRPALRDLVLVDCPDPDTTEEAGGRRPEAGGLAKTQVASDNLSRLRAILPHCDVLLVAATQQKYRSARVADELTAAARGAHVVYVQTHADRDDDIRDDWRDILADQSTYIFFVDSLAALADARAGRQPRGDFADLLDLLTRRMAGAAANRIRRANFLDLAAETLDACRQRIEDGLPSVKKTQDAIDEQRAVLSRRIAERMQSELSADRRQWENRLLGRAASRWGLSPFSLVLRTYQGLGGLLSGGLLFRARSPAQLALWGAMEGTRSWRTWRRNRRADRGADRAAEEAWDRAELHKAAIIIDGYAAEAGLDRRDCRPETIAAEAAKAAEDFAARASADLQSLVDRLAQRRAGWFTRWRYELLLATMLGFILFRLGKNYFYDSWLATPKSPVLGLDFYLASAFWLLLWCMLLLWGFCGRLRRGLRGSIARLTADWQTPASAEGLFAGVQRQCRRAERFHQELENLRAEVERLGRQVERGGDV